MTNIFEAPHLTVNDLDTLRKHCEYQNLGYIHVVRVYNKKEDIPKKFIVDKNIFSCDIQTFKDNPFFFGPILFKKKETTDYFKSLGINMIIIYGKDTELASPLFKRMTNIKLV